ncbi:MAG: retron Ec67 family RNA-directed DNA polymerase/endonuclease [Gudongella sp.]|nr:retron Ec67 family RNA-directed DNA polymerase/endonuclease [Gudongella sp.]
MKKFRNITSRKELAGFLKISEKKLNYILYVVGTSSYYTSFEIPKKNGGIREIHAPTKDLKTLQRNLATVLSDINEKNKKNNISHGFERKKTIITNSEIHRNKRYVINMDLKDYFESFHFGRVRGYFEKNNNFNLPINIATIIAQLTCFNGSLPQGAPTSPVITNMICNILDIRLLQVARKYKLNYTRYADDLTFSTNHKGFLEDQNLFINDIRYEVEKFGLFINDSKTRVLYKDSRQEVTGLVVNKVINVKREYYKRTRAMANNLYYNGKFLIEGEEGSINELEGRFAFINQLNIYNNGIKNEKRYFSNLSSKEKEYQKFLFYKYFITNDKPLIITEGKTDILYLKSAMRKYYHEYPELIVKKDDKFEYKVMFLKRIKTKEKEDENKKDEKENQNKREEDRGRLNYFLGISGHGGNSFKNIFELYNDKKLNVGSLFFNKIRISPKNPVFLVFDNEQKKNNKPLADFKNHAHIKEKIDVLKKIEDYNLYIITNPLVEVGEDIEEEIEDLFEKKLLQIEINGRKFNRKTETGSSKTFGKNIFSHYVYDNYENINFENFIPMLNEMKNVINEYKEN